MRSSYVVEDYETTLSIKAVVSGESWYTTPQGRYLVTPGVFLILNEGQRYSMDAGPGTETLCPFFAPGFVSGAQRDLTTSAERLLDDPETMPGPLDFVEQLHPMSGPIGAILRSMQPAVRSRQATTEMLEESFHCLALELVGLRDEDRRRTSAYPAIRPSTREELYRRLARARDFLASCYGEPLTVADAASVAALSTFHFHRSFKAAFGVSPMQYLRQRRLEVACELLRRGRRVTDVAGAVGFESPTSFTTLFRKVYGRPPSDLQKSRIEEVRPRADV